MHRICIYTKDVQVITGKSEKVSRKILQQIRERKNKESHQPITITELCEYFGFEEEQVKRLLRLG